MKNDTLLQVNSNNDNMLSRVEELKPRFADQGNRDIDIVPISNRVDTKMYTCTENDVVSLDPARERFLAHLKEAGKAGITVINYKRTLKHFYRFLKERGITAISAVTPGIILEYQDHVYQVQDKSEETLKFYIKDISRFFDHLIRLGIANDNPAKDTEIKTKTIDVPEVITRYYSMAEITRKYRHSLKDKDVSFSFFRHENTNINTFIYFLEKQGINSVYKVTEKDVEAYKEYLNSPDYNDGKGLNVSDQIEKLRALRRFYKWLMEEKMHKHNPAAYLKIGEHERYLKKQGRKIVRVEAGIKTDIQRYIEMFLEYKSSLGYSPKTMRKRRFEFDIFIRFLKAKNITTVEAVRKEDVLSYMNYLSNTYRTNKGGSLAQCSKSGLIGAVKGLFQFLVRFEYLNKDPTIQIESLKSDDGIPRTLMTPNEVETLLNMPDHSTPIGIRDKALFETLYSTGMRSSELCYLKVCDIDFTRGLVRIDHPKGGRPQERIVPIGKIAMNCITEYINQARPYLLRGPEDILFVSTRGKMLQHDDVGDIVKKYVFKARFKKNITAHSFRVTCATEMLKNKADIRYVQQQLGHKKITSTQRYTRVMPIDLKLVHSQTHPRERQASQ